jgi:endonuclease G
VFNAQWQVIALHHWGGPSVRGMKDEDGKRVPVHVNEGVRASAIVGHLEEAVRNGSIPAAQARLLAEERARASGPAPEMRPDAPGVGSAAEFRNEGNRAVWRIPLEISVQLPSLARDASSLTHEPAAGQAGGPGAGGADRTTAGAEKLAPDPDYGSRPGYRADFMSGHIVAMPKLSSAMAKQAARNREAEPGEDPHELKYRHFSLVMNARRRLAFFTACNIDGKTAKDVDRKTGAVTPAKVGSEAMEAAEAGEQWFLDPRIGEDQQTPQALYDRQATVLEDGRAAGGQAHRNRMFQRGHLVRRKDPSWGSNADARAADADTFHFTNCAPQTGFFNMGTAPRSLAGSGGGNLWRALEDHVLDNAVREARRISVFTGPVFATSDPKWRSDVVAGFRVPREFWKIVVWSDRGRLRSLAMIASQKAVMGKKLPGTKEELDQLDKVEDFVATVAKIEKLTGLDFGKAVRDGDISAGGSEAMRRVSDFAEVFSAGGRRSKRRAAR